MQNKTSTIKKLNKFENSIPIPLLMKTIFTLFLLVITLNSIALSSAILPNLQPERLQNGTAGGGNVTSVSSGDNCIFVSPTTGVVQITFNTSCGGSGSGDGSFNITYQTFAYNQTTPALNYVRIYYYNKTEIDSFNASWISTFNITYQTWAYNQTTAVFNTVLLNNTIAQYGNLIGFNSTFNSTYAQFAYNQTTSVFTISLLNNTIAQYGNLIGFNLTFNQTYNNLLNQTCPAGQVVNGTLINGTLKCQPINIPANSTTVHCSNVTGNTLCTTGNPAFNNLTLTSEGFYSGLGTYDLNLADPALRWIRFTAFGGTVEAANLNFALGAFLFQSMSNLNLFFANDDLTSVMNIADNGIISFGVANGVTIGGINVNFNVTDSKTTVSNNFETRGILNNLTGSLDLGGNSTFRGTNNTIIGNTGILGNLSFGGTRIDGYCSLGQGRCEANFTGWNITSEHQISNLTASLNTWYINNETRPVKYTATIQLSASPSFPDTSIDASATVYHNFTSGNNILTQTGYVYRGTVNLDASNTLVLTNDISFEIPPKGNWTIASSGSGSTSVALLKLRKIVI